MALIKCPECGNSISDKAEKCPHCGLPAKFFAAQERGKNEALDYSQLGNTLISFDGDYTRLFSHNRYITHRDAVFLQDTYGSYYDQLKNRMIF